MSKYTFYAELERKERMIVLELKETLSTYYNIPKLKNKEFFRLLLEIARNFLELEKNEDLREFFNVKEEDLEVLESE